MNLAAVTVFRVTPGTGCKVVRHKSFASSAEALAAAQAWSVGKPASVTVRSTSHEGIVTEFRKGAAI